MNGVVLRIALAAVIALAIVIRVLLVAHATWQPVSDSRDYHDFARSLAHGQGYVQVYQGETAVFRDLTLRAYRMPGYPAFLALVYTIGGWRPIAAFLANVACDIITILCMFGIGRTLGGTAVGLVVAVILACRVLYTPSLTSETLFTALWSGLGWILVRWLPQPTPRRALVFGILLVTALFVRPIGIAALPAAMWVMSRSGLPRRAVIRCCLVASLPVVIGIAAWTARNARVLHAFVPLSTNFGTHNATSFGFQFEPVTAEVRRRGGGEIEIDRALRGEIDRRVRSHPAAALRVYGDRLVGLFGRRPDWITERVLMERTFVRPKAPAWVRRGYLASRALHPPVDLLAVAGLVPLFWRRRTTYGVAAMFATFTLLHAAVSRSDERFAAPLYPFLALAAAFALVSAVQQVKRVRLRLRTTAH